MRVASHSATVKIAYYGSAAVLFSACITAPGSSNSSDEVSSERFSKL